MSGISGSASFKLYPTKFQFVAFFNAVANLYKNRWQVELFFRWIKQHLRIQSFYGVTENAVKTQIWVSVSVYVPIAIIKKSSILRRTSTLVRR